MAKKSRRERRAGKPTATPRVPRSQPTSAPIPKISPAGIQPRSSAPTRAAAPVTRTVTDFREEYRYVAQDLRRIAVLAGVIFTALIVLSFVLR
ncbi:MAG: hypothetical protein A2Z04_08670 [Chloroflexi bacterium RBG_16_57_9]|nr:MAG: hypothetical protein A2Z04_08670 [Chloroflexi bacterium RBG_16_57_9]